MNGIVCEFKMYNAHFIEIFSIGNVIHGHGASTEAQECLGEYFLFRNVIREKKMHETLKLLLGGEGQGIEVATKCWEGVRY